MVTKTGTDDYYAAKQPARGRPRAAAGYAKSLAQYH